jgi:pimeloyl-ACP methyl ester carboxylesterase
VVIPVFALVGLTPRASDGMEARMNVRVFILVILVLFGTAITHAGEPVFTEPKPVLVSVHGAWAGGWQMKKVVPLLEARGYEVHCPTLSGLGERFHTATADIGLETHIQDIVNYILFADLRQVILLGHSYGGMVITGVADRIPERIARLVYLDAFLPENGESALDVRRGLPEPFAQNTREGFIQPWWLKPDKPFPRDVPHPLKTMTDAIVLRNPAAAAIPGTYILTVEPRMSPETDDFFPFYQRAQARGWTVILMEADHVPQWRKPAETAALLATIR